MATNIEIKAFDRDPEATRRRCEGLCPAPPELLEQTDTFFVTPRQRLKLREFGDGTAELIAYDRPDTEEPGASRYVRTTIPEPVELRDALSRTLGVRCVVRKRRAVYHAGRTRIHLDSVDDLGEFVELEVVLEAGEAHAGGVAEAEELMRRLGLTRGDLVARAYADLLEEESGG